MALRKLYNIMILDTTTGIKTVYDDFNDIDADWCNDINAIHQLADEYGALFPTVPNNCIYIVEEKD